MQEETYWENGDVEYITECSRAPESIKVTISSRVKNKIDILMKRFKNDEWLAYLIGKDNVVTDLYIPLQKVTSVDVHVHEDISGIGIIGILHSHHNMTANFSGIDHDGVNKNHDISLLVTHTNIIGQVRYKTPCGAYIAVDADIEFEYNTDFDVTEFIKYIDENIIKEVRPRRFNQHDMDLSDIQIDNICTTFDDFDDSDDKLYDDLCNEDLYDYNKVRTVTGYRNITQRELSKLTQLEYLSPEFCDYLDEINFE